MNGRGPRGGRSELLIPIVVSSIVALALRAAYLVEAADNPFWRHLGLDLEIYHEWAQRIASGSGLGDAPFRQAPLFPLLLGITYSILGADPVRALWMHLLPGVGAVALTAWCAGTLFGPRAAWGAGLLLALYKPAIFYTGVLLPPTWTMFLSALFLFAWQRWSSLAAGLAGGFLTLAQPAALGLVLPSIQPRSPRRTGWLVLGLSLPILLTLLYNGLSGGVWAPIAVNRGINLYIGNGPEANGAYVRPPEMREDRDLLGIAAAETALRKSGEWPPGADAASTAALADRYWTKRAVDSITSDPTRALQLFARKVTFLIAQYEMPQVESFRFESRFSSILRAPLPGMALLLALAVWGALLARGVAVRRLVIPILAATALLCLFFVTARFRLVLAPWLAVLAGAGVGMWPSRSARDRIVACAVASLALLASLLAASGIDVAASDGQYLHRLGVIAERENDTSAAIARYREALSADPTVAKAHINLGTLLARGGQLDEARGHLEQGVRLDALSAIGRVSLGQLEQVTGGPELAIEWFRAATEIDPTLWSAREGFVFASYEVGRIERNAAEELARLAPPGSPPAQRAQMFVALIESRRSLPDGGWVASARLREADLLVVQGRLDPARAIYQALQSDETAGAAATLTLRRLFAPEGSR